MQEGVFALVCLHDFESEDNPFFQSEPVAKWVEWGFDYWTSLQHENGAFDEAYPFEQCLAATAFTTFYLGSAFVRWGQRLPPELRGRVIKSFRKAGQWLCRNDETHGILSNHLAVAVAALEIMAGICGQKEFSDRAKFFLARIFSHQSDEGWMREYDGADIGYGTHGFFYLAKYWQMTGCAETLAALKRFAGFLIYFIHPDGTIGGEYSSRNTEFYFPAGFEILADHCPHSSAIASGMRKSINEKKACGLWAMDSFNFLPLLNNLLFAAESAQPREVADVLPWQRASFSVYFAEAGLWIVNRESYYAIAGISKGGTVSIFDKLGKRIVARHAGHYLTWQGRIYTSQDHLLNPVVSWGLNGNEATFSVPWKSVSRMTFTPLLFLGFRMFTLTFPMRTKLKGRLNKILLRQAARQWNLPTHVIQGKKVPFHLPLEQSIADKRVWEMVEDNLTPDRIRRRGLVQVEYVSFLKQKARGGDYLLGKKLFSLVILEIWFRTFIDGDAI